MHACIVQTHTAKIVLASLAAVAIHVVQLAEACTVAGAACFSLPQIAGPVVGLLAIARDWVALGALDL